MFLKSIILIAAYEREVIFYHSNKIITFPVAMKNRSDFKMHRFTAQHLRVIKYFFSKLKSVKKCRFGAKI